MVFDIHKVSGIGEYRISKEKIKDETMQIFWKKVKVEETFGDTDEGENEKAFLIVRKNTLEVRCDRKLSELLREKYESVMESRYFGRGGIEIVNSGQLEADEIEDLVRLSYNLS